MAESEHPEQEKRESEGVRERLEERMEEYRERLQGIFPPEFKEHVRAARREFWLAVRSLIDARLEAIEQEAKRKPRPGGRINVE